MKFIGIDIGDGESAAAVLNDTGAVLPRVVDLGAYQSLLSVVGEAGGKPLVGQDVLLEPKARGVSARFKSRFLTDPDAAGTIEKFAQGLREKLAPTLQSGDFSIALGCPAGWTAHDRAHYADLVRGAGFPNLHAVAESRAAFLYTHYDTDINLSPEELAQPTLVIDIGSSTTDFAYIVEGKETDVGVFGANHLGGGQLDGLILEDAVAQSDRREEIEKAFRAYPTWRNYCELEARKLKETYFRQESLWVEHPCEVTSTIWADVNAPLKLGFSLNREKIQALLNRPLEGGGSQSFLERLRAYLRAAVERTAAHPPRQLILTGGASRMEFFQQECRSAFPDAKLTVCRDPEFSIARGLSIAARLDCSLERFRGRIDQFFKEGFLREDIRQNLHFLIRELTPVLEERIMTRCVEPVRKEKGMDALQRQEELRERIRKEFEENPCTPETDAIVAGWIGARLTASQERLDGICEENGVDRADMRLARLGLRVSLDKLRLNLVRAQFLELFREFLYNTLHVGKTPRRQVREALEKELGKPDGDFSKRLIGDLEAELRQQIQDNIEKVEIHIS